MKVINKKTTYLEASLIGLFIGFLLLIIRPLNLMSIHIKIVASSAIISSLLTIYVIKFFIFFREETRDERDFSHHLSSSMAAYLVGSLTLFTGIVYEYFHGDINPWLLISLTAMLIAKLVTILYLEVYK
jgi:hypothetical protein